MRKMLSYALYVLGSALSLGALYYCINVYFTISVKDGITSNGFGVQLYDAPFLLRYVTSDWPGLKWFIIYTIIDISSCSLVASTFILAKSEGSVHKTKTREHG